MDSLSWKSAALVDFKQINMKLTGTCGSGVEASRLHLQGAVTSLPACVRLRCSERAILGPSQHDFKSLSSRFYDLTSYFANIHEDLKKKENKTNIAEQEPRKTHTHQLPGLGMSLLPWLGFLTVVLGELWR